MSLVEKQWEFLRQVAELIKEIERRGWVATGGELWRHPNMQKYYVQIGRSRTMNSQHLKRLAIDLNLFRPARPGEEPSVIVNGSPFVLTWNVEDIEPIGRFWESLSKDNRWGGHFRTFKDVPHFEKEG